jgi:hypothetical protein
MFVIGLDLIALAERKDTTSRFCRPAPFFKVPVLVDFSPKIGSEMIGMYGDGPFCRYAVAIPPGKFAVDGPQVKPVSIGEEYAPDERVTYRRLHHATMLRRPIRRGHASTSEPEHDQLAF